MEGSTAGLPSDKASRRFLEKFPNSKLVRNLREKGDLAPDEQVVAGVPLFKISPGFVLLILIGLLPWLLVFFSFQRISYLIVTDRRVLLTRWSLGGTKVDRVLSLERPVHLALGENPKRTHFFGNKVRLPQEVAEFLGRDTAYAQLGNVADYTFRHARAEVGVSGS